MLTYKAVNESIKAIDAGMDFSRNDVVGGILGGGDVGFMAISEGAKFQGWDNNVYQINFVNSRKYGAERGDLKRFFSSGTIERNDDFSKKNLSSIVKNLEDFQVNYCGDLFSGDVDFSEFNKLYFSNALTSGVSLSYESDYSRLLRSTETFKVGGLVYLADSILLGNDGQFVEDSELTKKARSFEHNGWSPQVLRKVA